MVFMYLGFKAANVFSATFHFVLHLAKSRQWASLSVHDINFKPDNFISGKQYVTSGSL